LIYYLQD
jgi:hypothetical protein